MIPIPPFEPDKSRFNPLATGDLKNCIPVADGWRPMPSLIQESVTGLSSACVGAAYVRTSSGGFTLIAGTQTGLYSYDTSTGGWTDISGASAPYAVPTGDKWSFSRYGNKLVAHNLVDPAQVYDIDGGGVFADLAGSPPRARYSMVCGEFLVLMHLDGESDTLHWSGIGDIEHWVLGEKGCDKQQLPSGEEIMGGIGDERGGLVIQRSAMRYMQFAPESGYTFTFASANEKRGTIAPLSIVQIGSGDFVYLSEDGFYRGVAGAPIGAGRVDRWFFANVQRENIATIRGVADPFEKIVWWTFIDASDTSYLIGYDWQLDRWCYIDNQTEELVAFLSPSAGWDTDGGVAIDDDAEPFDSRLGAGGAPIFAAFDTSHQLAYFSGMPMAAELRTAEIQMNPAGRYFVNGARIVTDATAATLEVGAADYHGGDLTWKGPVAMSTRTKFVGVRSDGRLHQFKIAIPAGQEWSVVTGIDAQGAASGS